MKNLCLAAALLAFTVPHANATTVYATGFETPDFVSGSIAGQGGWIPYPGGYPVGLIENAASQSGAQALDVISGTDSLYQFSPGLTGTVIISADVLESSANFNYGIALDAPNLDFLVQIVGVGKGGFYIGNYDSNPPTVDGFTIGLWHHLLLGIDFGTRTATGSVDGVSLGSVTINTPSAPISVGYLDLFSLSTGAGNHVFFDNLTVTATVPEPASFAMLSMGLGGALVVVRRRPRKTGPVA